jgi:hypothetical protein
VTMVLGSMLRRSVAAPSLRERDFLTQSTDASATATHGAAEQLDERQRDSIKDEHRPYNAADGPT